MMGYTSTGYRLWNIAKQKLIISGDVIFNENNFYFKMYRVQADASEDKCDYIK